MNSIINETKSLTEFNLFSPVLIISISFILIFAVLLIINLKYKNKIIEILYITVLVALLLFLSFMYRHVIASSLDKVIEFIMKNLLFPNVFHILLILIADIFITLNLIKYVKESKIFVVSSIVVNSILAITSVIILCLIAGADNIYYIYKNRVSLGMMQFTTFSFYAYLIILLIYKYLKKNKVKIKRTKEGIEILTLD